MLNILIENFEENFLPPGNHDQQDMATCLEQEWARLNDPDYLEKMVIGTPLLQWDFRVLDQGFSDLILPFTQSNSFIPVLFLHALRDLGCDNAKAKQAMIILEYAYYIAAVNDYFNFQQVFTQKERNLKEYARLTQIKYAGQYIATYPYYLLIKNVFEIGDETNNKIHKLLSDIIAATGISRGVMVKWSHRHFKDVNADMYCQNAINSLSNFFICPVVLAAIFADVPAVDLMSLKRAFSHLTLFAKLRAERKICSGTLKPDVPPVYMDSLKVLTFPGLPYINSGVDLDWREVAGETTPHIPSMYDLILKTLTTSLPADGLKATMAREEQSFAAFLLEMEQTGLLKNTTDLIRKSYKL